jgi:large subunit ribosomal protein L17
MRHGRQQGKLGVKTKHRKALLRNMVRNLVIRKQIRTTVRRAKVVSAFADSMVELAKRGDLHARRLLISRLGCADTAKTLITQIAPHFKERRGGYTRVLRLGMHRAGDGSELALLEFTATIEGPAKKPKKEKKAKVVQEEAPKLKKEKEKAPEKKKDEPKVPAAEKGKAESKEKKESEKRGGFLGALRKFLKGDDESK